MRIRKLDMPLEADWNLLLLADPDRNMVLGYLEKSQVYVLEQEAGIVAQAVMLPLEDGSVELKNLAVRPEAQGKGHGTSLIQAMFRQYADRTIYVGTAVPGVAFYQRAGFVSCHRVDHFFTHNYPEPVYDRGVHCVHMYYLKHEPEQQPQRIALVTGANSGMGKATCTAFASMGIKTVMLCRSEQRGRAALEQVQMDSGGDVELMLCDLSYLQDIGRFCTEFRQRFDRLDILVCNAGVISLDRRETRDGLEQQFGVNHLGHFMLTNSLLSLLPQGGRIVVVGSGAHKAGKLDFDHMELKRGYNVVSAYGRSKLCNLLFTRELARRLDGTGVTVNCVHPGAVATGMGVDRETGFGKGITGMLRPLFQTPDEGAATAIYVATSPECEGVSGAYYYRKRIASSSKRSHDRELAERLWAYSEYLVNQYGVQP